MIIKNNSELKMSMPAWAILRVLMQRYVIYPAKDLIPLKRHSNMSKQIGV